MTDNPVWFDDCLSSSLCQRLLKNPPVWPESFAWDILRICTVLGGILQRDILVADIEEVKNLDASEIHARRLNAKEVKTPKMVKISNSRSQIEK